jgi:predicted oxidoreductase (fatty acid repression mutant protein)
MHQFVLWAGLEAEGLGANLQHYSPIVDAAVAQRWGVDADWQLKAQLVFGGRAGGPFHGAEAGKPQTALEERLKVFGAKE